MADVYEHPTSLFPKLFAQAIFPGSYGTINYDTLESKGYPSLGSGVREEIIENNELSSKVKCFIYKGKPDAEVLIFFHGNIRPSEFLGEFFQFLAGRRDENTQLYERTVIAPHFTGYRGSSAPLFDKEGGLEITSWSNARAVCEWTKKNFPNQELVVMGRSIGTFSVAASLELDYIKKAVLICPFIIKHCIVPYIPSGYLPYVLAPKAFPTGKTARGVEYSTNGFNVLERLKNISSSLEDKQVLIFYSETDEYVRPAAVEEIESLFGYRATKYALVGGHKAFPGDKDNSKCLKDLLQFTRSESAV